MLNFSAGTLLSAAPDRKPQPPEKQEKYATPGKNDKHGKPGNPGKNNKPGKPGAPGKPVKPAKPAPLPPPAPVIIKPSPLLPPAPVQVVTYHPKRNTYTIQLNANNAILFEQRLVGLQELRDKIRMVKYDRPRPIIRIRVANGVNPAQLNYTLSELKAAGFDDVEIIHLGRRTKAVPAPRKPAKRLKR